MPERKRVAGMQAAVCELVHRADVQRAERVELAHAAEVEERIPVHDARDMPKRDPEEQADQRDGKRVPRERPGDETQRER